MNYNSKAIEGASVTFPQFNAERHYMVPFFQRTGLPSHLSHWQPTVDAMLQGVDSEGPIFMMVDQKLCTPGESHRRGGVHIDGYWCGPTDPSVKRVSGMGWGPEPGWEPTAIYANSDNHHKISGQIQDWGKATLEDPEAIILASNYSSCRGYLGDWKGEMEHKGACEHIDVASMENFMLKPNTVYTGNVAFLHESVPLQEAVERTIVRLNVRGWEPTWH